MRPPIEKASSLQAKHGFLVSYAELRRQEGLALTKTTEVLTHNLGVREHNIGIARSRGDRALEETSRQELASDQRALAETRARISSSAESQARVFAEIAALTARIERLRAR